MRPLLLVTVLAIEPDADKPGRWRHRMSCGHVKNAPQRFEVGAEVPCWLHPLPPRPDGRPRKRA